MAKVSAKSVESGGILAIKNGNFYFYPMELKVLDNGQKIKYIPNFDEQNYPICRLNWINSSHTFSLKPANQDLKSVQSI